MSSRHRTVFIGAALISIALASPAQGQDFRFLTTSLPQGTSNAFYYTRIFTANASGPVAYSVAPDSPDALPPGMSLDAVLGTITGRPTSAANDQIKFAADDGTTSISITLQLKVTAAGGGGNTGVEFTTTSLAVGRVGLAYANPDDSPVAIEATNGQGPYIFGAVGLPPGLRLDGQTGVITGTPTAGGTFNVTFTAVDVGENYNRVFTILPIIVLPPDPSTFQFTTVILDNGEVGVPFQDTVVIQGASAAVEYSAVGLPPGLTLDPATGEITGTPTAAGTFDVLISATSGGETITTNLFVWMVGPATGNPPEPRSFYWLFASLPSAVVDVPYAPFDVQAAGAALEPPSYTADGLPAGITYVGGTLSGTPTAAGTYPVTFSATDYGVSPAETITLQAFFVVLPSGGGDPNYFRWLSYSLPDATVDVPYGVDPAVTVAATGAVGTIAYSAEGLPAGITYDPATGALAGTPTQECNCLVTFSAIDDGVDPPETITLQAALVVLPGVEPNNFVWLPYSLPDATLNVAYGVDPAVTVAATGAVGTIAYSAEGLPAGITYDPATGALEGTPTEEGTFSVTFSATDDGVEPPDTITQQTSFVVLPAIEPNDFRWLPYSISSAIVDVPYGVDPAVIIAATDAVGTIAYSALGLPAGMTYDPATGALAGTPTEEGTFPVTFTATDDGVEPPDTITLETSFVVLPGGGEPDAEVATLWVKKQQVKTGRPGADSWKAQLIYNDDRRTGVAFDPALDPFVVSLGTRTIEVNPGSMTVSGGKYSYASPKGVVPAVKITIDSSKQSIQVATKGDTLTDALPSVLLQYVALGAKEYELEEYYDAKGKFAATSGYRGISFVCSKAKVTVKGPGEDSLSLSCLLGDPSFSYQSGVTPVIFRLLDGDTVLVAKNLTALVASQEKEDAKSGRTLYKLKGSKETAGPNALSKFSYESGKGKMAIAFTEADLAALPAGEAHVTVELTIGEKVYSTGVTVFSSKPGSYSTKRP